MDAGEKPFNLRRTPRIRLWGITQALNMKDAHVGILNIPRTPRRALKVEIWATIEIFLQRTRWMPQPSRSSLMNVLHKHVCISLPSSTCGILNELVKDDGTFAAVSTRYRLPGGGPILLRDGSRCLHAPHLFTKSGAGRHECIINAQSGCRKQSLAACAIWK